MPMFTTKERPDFGGLRIAVECTLNGLDMPPEAREALRHFRAMCQLERKNDLFAVPIYAGGAVGGTFALTMGLSGSALLMAFAGTCLTVAVRRAIAWSEIIRTCDQMLGVEQDGETSRR